MCDLAPDAKYRSKLYNFICLLLQGYSVLFMRICKTRLYLRIISTPFHIKLDALLTLTLALEYGIWNRATLISALVRIYSVIYRLGMRTPHFKTILMMYWNDVNTHMNIVRYTLYIVQLCLSMRISIHQSHTHTSLITPSSVANNKCTHDTKHCNGWDLLKF